MSGNDWVAWLLRSRWHALLSGNTLLLTITGRKSGREITLPVNYVRTGDELWVLSSRERRWWRNLVDGAAARLHLRGREVTAYGKAIVDEAQTAEMLAVYLSAVPMAARSMRVRKVGDGWDASDLRRAAQERVMVRLSLPGEEMPPGIDKMS